MQTTTKPQPEANSEAILSRIERMVRWSDDFRLGFVKCNHPSQQKDMRDALLARFVDKRILEIDLDKPIVSLLDEITARWDAADPPDAVCVYGLEKSINEQHEASPVLGRLNNDRDLLRRAAPVALLIWLPDFALDLVTRGAPDFWAWRSGVYEFPTDNVLFHHDSAAALASEWPSLSSLRSQDKWAEIARLEELLRTARTLPRQGKREQQTVARLLYQLGLLHYALGNWGTARACFEESLAISEHAGDRGGVAHTLHHLGIVQQDQGNLAEAARLYEQSFEIAREVGDQLSAAYSLGQISNIRFLQGSYLAAQELYERVLNILKKLDNKIGIAGTLRQLGAIQQCQGNLAGAEQLYKQSLELAEEAGDQRGIAGTLGQLGTIQRRRGNVAEAIRLHEQSLKIEEKLGDKFGIAAALWQMGELRHQQGQLRDALQNYVAAWTLLHELQSTNAKLVEEDIQKVRAQVGEHQFRTWLMENFGNQAPQIIASLEGNRGGSHGNVQDTSKAIA